MKLLRRNFLHLVAGVPTLLAMPRFAWAQSYPARPVRIIVGFPAGGTTDIGARLIAQWLSERLGQPFIVENRPGAGTHMATEAVASAVADGYTLLMATASNAINETLYTKINYNFLRDIVPVAGVIRIPIRPGGESGGPGQDGSRTDRFRQGQFGKDQLGIVWHRHQQSSDRRAVQDDGWDRNACTCPIAGPPPCSSTC